MPEDISKDSGLDLSCKEKVVSKISDGRAKLRSWLNKKMRIEMSDGRILLGIFLCTDRDGNVILGSCTEYINPEAWGFSDEPRMLGLVMVPGKHIVRVRHDADVQSGHMNLTKSVSVTPVNDPIEWSQNPLWDPNLSDSPDSEGPQRPANKTQPTSETFLQEPPHDLYT